MEKPWIPQVRHLIIHGSSQWMREMAFVVHQGGQRVVLRVALQTECPPAGQSTSDFRGLIVSDQPSWSGKQVSGFYDTSFRRGQPWLMTVDQ